MTTKVLDTPTAIDHYGHLFDTQADRLPGAELAWLAELRATAMARFSATGFPTPRDEAWHYTSLAPVGRIAFEPAGEQCIGLDTDDLAPYLLAPDADARLVFVNGRLAPSLCHLSSLSAGVRLAGLAQAVEQWPEEVARHLGHHLPADAPMADLNTALAGDGAVLLVEAGVDAGTMELLFLTTASGEPLFSAPRNVIAVAAGGRATVVESHIALGTTTAFADPATEIDLGDTAHLDYLRVVHEPGAFHTSTVAATQGRDSRLRAHLLCLGGRICRTDFATRLAGPGAQAETYGLALAGDRDHLDLTTRIDHAAVATRSREQVKQIVAGRGRGCFSGLVHVHPGAQQTDARLANANLLLSERAEADTRPQLLIYADDVKCSHGATVGRLDAEALFYLRSRGIDEPEARQILTTAFAGSVTAAIADPALRRAAGARTTGRLVELLAEEG